MNILLTEFLQGVQGKWKGRPSGLLTRVSTDSRDAAPGVLFFALKGDRFDGHDFVPAVLAAGGAAVVSDVWFAANKKVLGPAECVYGVPDTLAALAEAAHGWRSRFTGRVVAVTGSSGKTTTRGMITTLLEGEFRVHGPIKNFNNEIGVPLTIFGARPEHDVLVLEMGMNHAGELHRIAAMARPDLAVVTNIGSAHIEYFGSRRGIAEAKKEIFDFFTEDNIAVLNGGDDFCEYLAAGVPGEKIYFSSVPEGMRVLADRGLSGYLLGTGDGREIVFSLGGEHNIVNLAAAVAVARKLGLNESVISERIAMIRGVNARTQIVEGRFTILNDSYNANPDSMRAVLVLLHKEQNRRRVAVLGDMFELGESSRELHRELGGWMAAERVVPDLVVLAGEAMASCREGLLEKGVPETAVHWYATTEEAASAVPGLLHPGDIVLLKGSRGMRMEAVLDALRCG